MLAMGSSRVLITAALTFSSTVQSIYVYNSIMKGGLTQLHFRHQRNPCQHLTAMFMCPSEDAWLLGAKQHQAVIPFKVWRSPSGWL